MSLKKPNLNFGRSQAGKSSTTPTKLEHLVELARFMRLNDDYLEDGEHELVELIHAGLINRDDDGDEPF